MIKKRIVCFSAIAAIALVVMFIAGSMTGAEANKVNAEDSDVELVLATENTEVYAGDEVTVTLEMSKNVGLTGLRFQVNFDENVLELVSAKAGNTLPFPTVNKADTFVGYAFALINQDDDGNDCDWTVTGNILTIKFKVKDNAQFGETKLSFDMSETDATDLAVNTLNISAEDLCLEVSCKHADTEEIVTKEATCTEKGKKTTKCTVCGETVKTEEIAAKGHTSGTAEVTKEATCTEKGKKTTKCTVCGEILKTEEITAKGHSYGKYTVTKEPTCTEKGEKTAVCATCKDEMKEEIPAKGHVYESCKITKEPTETENGEMELVCSVCQNIVKTDVPKLSDIVFTVVESDGTALEDTYVVGSVVKFEAKVYGDTAKPQVGSIRYIPVSYKLNSEETKFAEGTYASELKLDNEGEYAFVVVYARELYDASGWRADGATYNHDIKITAEAKKVVEEETTTVDNKVDVPNTGDESSVIVISILMVAVAIGFVINRKRITDIN